jgi:hypothetical protein
MSSEMLGRAIPLYQSRLNDLHAALAAAGRVMLLGAGPVGIELDQTAPT